MKFLLLALAGLLSVLVVGCSLISGDPTITKGEIMSGTITSGDTEVDGWKSKTYKLDVVKGLEYFIRLTHENSETVGIWSPDADAYIVEVNSEVTAHTASYKFKESGSHELFVRSPNTEVPADYNLKVWLPGTS